MGSTIIGCGLSRQIGPTRQLGIRAPNEGSDGATGLKTIELSRKFRQPFVDPCRLVAVVIPVNHVLELMGQNSVIVILTWRCIIQVDVEHLLLVAIRIDQGRKLVGAGIVPPHAGHMAIENTDVEIAIHAGRPLTAEELACQRIDVGLKPFGRTLNLLITHVVTVLYPHIDMGGNVAQSGHHLEITEC